MIEGNDSSGVAASYAQAGVDTVGIDIGLGRLIGRLNATFEYPRTGRPVLRNGFYANVLDVGGGLGIAIGTDGVGTKVLVAHAVERYDTIGIDLIAMNVNDLICVGAEPIALVDYIAVPDADPSLLEQLSIGLAEGAARARISIPGGEIAQVRELLRPHPPSNREGFDLVATAIGVVRLDRLRVGRDIVPGDVVIALASNGIHSNGLTLARRALVGDVADPGAAYAERPPSLAGRSVADELLRPTRIYVREAMALLESELRLRALAHITGDGLLNLLRVDAPGIGFVLDSLPEPPPIFQLIAERSRVTPAEMYQTFNMGVGLCAVVAKEDVGRALGILAEAQANAGDNAMAPQVVGEVVADPDRTLRLPGQGLVGRGKKFLG